MSDSNYEFMEPPARRVGESITEWVSRTYDATDHDKQAAEFLEYFQAVIERAGTVEDYMEDESST